MNTKLTESIRSDCLEVLKSRADQLSALKGDTLTVTGGTGFVGTWIAEMVACLNDQFGFGTELVLVARGTDLFEKQRPHLAKRKDIRLVKSDVRHTFEIPRETSWLVHAAATPDTRHHATYPVETMAVIAQGTEAILRTVDRCSAFKMFMNLSSGNVYGAQPDSLERVPESCPTAPQAHTLSSAYAEAKRYSETFCASFRSQYRVPIVNVRPFSFLGPYQSLQGPWAANNFIADSISGKSIRVLGDGQTVRSYMYPSDLAFWLLRILTSAQSGSCYNVGSPEPVTLEKLARLVAGHFSPRPDIQLSAGGAQAHRSRLVPDVSAAAEKFSLSLTVPLETALARTIQWYKSQ